MASETIDELWKLANTNSDKIIKKEEFEEELSKNIYENLYAITPRDSINDIKKEYERTLSNILNQATANPNSLGSTKNGKFSVSTGIVSKAVKIVKLQNNYIPNTDEYNKRMSLEGHSMNLNDGQLFAEKIDIMITNYKDLNVDEKKSLWDRYFDLDENQRRQMRENEKKENDELRKKAKALLNKKDQSEVNSVTKKSDKIYELVELAENGDTEAQRRIIEMYEEQFSNNSTTKNWKDAFNKLNGHYIGTKEEYKEFLKKIEEFEKKYGEFDLDKTQDIERIKEIIKNDPEVAGIILYKYPQIKNKSKELYNELENLNKKNDEKQKELSDSVTHVEGARKTSELKGQNTEKFMGENFTEYVDEFSKLEQEKKLSDLDNKVVQGENVEIKLPLNITSELNQLPNALVKAGFSQEEIKEALSQYKELLSEVPKEPLTSDDIIDSLYDKADSKNLTERTEEILGIIIPLNYNDSLNDMLLNNRDEFLQELDNVISKDINLEQEIQFEGELEEAINQYFEDNHIEMDTSAIEAQKQQEISSKDNLTVEQAQLQQNFQNASLLKNEHMDPIYILNGATVTIDEEWLQFFQDIQEKGGDLEQAYEIYRKEQEIEEIEAETAQENTEKEEVQEEQEEIVTLENRTSKQPIEENELSAETLEVAEDRDLGLTDISKSKKSKKVAVVKKDDDGKLTDVQIFKPLEFEFFRQSEITTEEWQEAVLAVQETAKESQRGDEENHKLGTENGSKIEENNSKGETEEEIEQ